MMSNHAATETVLWLNTGGLALGAIGAILLALFTKVFITIQPDGSQQWGPPNGMPNEEWRENNRRLRRMQNYVIPAGYVFIVIGFCAQLLALWLPALVAALERVAE
jgi:hypothetical protein